MYTGGVLFSREAAGPSTIDRSVRAVVALIRSIVNLTPHQAPRARPVIVRASEPGLGELVEPGDVEQLAAAMAKVLRFDASDREATGAATRRRVIDCYSLEANADALDDLYHRLARGQRSGP